MTHWVGTKAARACWKQLARDPFFASLLVKASPALRGHHLIGFGASVILTRAFVEAELSAPRPDINSRVIANVCAGLPTLASRAEVAKANANGGVDILILYGSCWRDELLNPAERTEIQTLFASKFVEWHAGYRIGRVLCETVHAGRKRSPGSLDCVPEGWRSFPNTIVCSSMITPEFVESVSAHLGNILFSFREPVLRLRESDRQMLLAALRGATDHELAERASNYFPSGEGPMAISIWAYSRNDARICLVRSKAKEEGVCKSVIE